MKYYKKLVGKKCYLSPINVEDAEKYTEWLNDFEVTINLGLATEIVTLENEKEILAKMAKEKENVFGIIDLKTDSLIGNCGLHGISHIHRTATFGIFIGNKKYWSKGYGTEAAKLTLDYGFNILNLNNIMLGVYEYNKRAIKCYEKCGFKIIGRRRESRILGGKKYDSITMDILAEEFESVYVKKFIKEACLTL